MDENSLFEHLEYEFFFEINFDDKWHNYVLRETNYYSGGIIDSDRFQFKINLGDIVCEVVNEKIQYFGITPLNDYTKLMLTLNKKGISRYHKLEKLKQ